MPWEFLAGRNAVTKIDRRDFLKKTSATVAGTIAAGVSLAAAQEEPRSLQVWSCGGLAEAFIPANELFYREHNCRINYTGAFAAALGKSLLGSAQTEIFAPRVLELALKLKSQGKMISFKPLCFTKYTVITRKGNPAKINSIEDLARPGIKLLTSPGASAPGGAATMGILKKSGVLDNAKKNVMHKGDCVQMDVQLITSGKADAAVMEQRIAMLPYVRGKVDLIDIPEEFIPAPPVTFVIGIMKWARNPELAQQYIDYITSEKGQKYFADAGFIPAFSDEGQRLILKYGVKDEIIPEKN